MPRTSCFGIPRRRDVGVPGGRIGDGAGPEGERRFLVTDTPEKFLAVAGLFLGRPVSSAEHVDV